MKRSWIIGTADDCDIRVTDEYASAHHAEVVREDGRIYVTDIGSTNGAYVEVDGVRAKATCRTPLPVGARLWIGRTPVPLTFTTETAMPEPDPQPPLTALAAQAAAQHEVFRAWLAAGFTEDQALKLLAAMVTASIQGWSQ